MTQSSKIDKAEGQGKAISPCICVNESNEPASLTLAEPPALECAAAHLEVGRC